MTAEEDLAARRSALRDAITAKLIDAAEALSFFSVDVADDGVTVKWRQSHQGSLQSVAVTRAASAAGTALPISRIADEIVELVQQEMAGNR